jgi:hypothetical protein
MLSQLDFKIFSLQTIKDQYVNDDEFKDAFANCIKGNHGENFTCRMGSCFTLTSCVSSKLGSSFVVTGSAWRRSHGTLWYLQNAGGVGCPLLLV